MSKRKRHLMLAGGFLALAAFLSLFCSLSHVHGWRVLWLMVVAFGNAAYFLLKAVKGDDRQEPF